MTVAPTSQIHGAASAPLASDAANAWLAWLRSGSRAPSDAHGVRFALAHCDSGVTWAYLDDAGAWTLGSTVDPELCPHPTATSLHELRLFGATAEILIWQTDDGQLRGRILADKEPPTDSDDPLSPFSESRRLRGTAGEPRDGFIRYIDSGGAEHLAPASFPQEFSVRHYLEQDPCTGAVRIAATRLVGHSVEKGGKL